MSNSDLHYTIISHSNLLLYIGIYVSSTFFDTAGERHALKTEVIPELNKLLLARGLSVVLVDVDWSNSRFSDPDRVRQVIQLIDNCRSGRENLPW